MEIFKEAVVKGAGMPDAHALEEINAMTRRQFGAEELYCFTVKLCDNEIDRDFERFTPETLAELGELFKGRSGIFDHSWTAEGQIARLYRTELVREDGVLTGAGDTYVYLKGWAYMLRSEENRTLIDEIEAGIKKEVSVSCAVEHSICSICGEEIGGCGHIRGREYDGALCYAELKNASDAYEWSFVAVPAQRGAGVMKRLGGGFGGTLKDFLAADSSREGWLEEYESLVRRAEVGDRRTEELRREVLRLGLMAEREIDGEILESMTKKLSDTELDRLKQSYEKKLDKLYPPLIQLGGEKTTQEDCGSEYII